MPVPPKVKAGCGVLAVFCAGMFCGIVALFLFLILVIPRSEGWKKSESKDFLANHFSKQLKLTEEQNRELRPGFAQFLDERWRLRREYLENDHELLESYFTAVESELSPEQRKRGKKLIVRWWNGKKPMVSP